MAKTKERNYNFLAVILAILTTLLILGLALYFIAYRPLKEKAVNRIAQQMLQSEISADDNMSVEDIIDSMSSEDKETLNELIDKHITPATAAKASKYLASGDTQGLKDYAKSILTEEEIDEVRELYKKYK